MRIDRYGAYNTVLDERQHPGRRAPACAARTGREFDQVAMPVRHDGEPLNALLFVMINDEW